MPHSLTTPLRHILAGISLIAPLCLQASTILVDLGNSSQPTSQTGWNNMSASTGGDPADLTNLVNSTGAVSSIDLAYTTSGTDSGAAGSGANYAGPYPASIASHPQSALQDGLFFSGDTITLTLSDLAPATSYDLALYGARGNNGTGASFTVTGETVTDGTLTTAFNNASQVLEFTAIAPNASGEITILMETVGSGSSSLNILQIDISDEEPVDPLAPPNPNLDPTKPNVIILYYDDLGYSNVGAYDTTQTSYTPNLDTLTNSGLRFDAGHSGDAVCTPSRYGLLTGRYCWRTSLKTRVTGGYSSPLIDTDRLTIPKMFQELGYTTAMVGKWHIGMQFYNPQGEPVNLGNDADVLGADTNSTSDDEIDFSHSLTETPTSYGFDYFFGTSASLDMPPYTWIENQTVLFKGGIATSPVVITNGAVTDMGSVDFSQASPASNSDFLEGEPIGAVNNVRDGAYDPNFVVKDYLQVQAQKVQDLLLQHSRDGEPFFIYVPIPSPHLPWSVQDSFDGITPFAYGDYLAQSDHYAGQILDALEDPDGDPTTDDGLDGNTIVFFSSDNGVSRSAMGQGLGHSHDGNGPFRGQKLDNWEGGTRVPFVIRWPGVTTPGATTDHTCWQGDFFATMAEFLNYDFSPDEAVDAESFLPILKGESMPAARRAAITQHAYNGQLAILDKDGVWKLLDGTGGNGSNSYDANNINVPADEASGTIFGTPRQLYNLSTDIGETNNLLPSSDPEILAKEQELYNLLNEIRGNTTYGTDGDSNVPLIDTDQDGIPNYYENETTGLDRAIPNDALLDFDQDALNNLGEFQNGADPYDKDSDDDRLEDGLEVLSYGSSPNSKHSDSDRLEDGDEVLIWDTNPILADTDNDGVDDDDELTGFSNPRDANSTLTYGPPTTIGLDPVAIQLVGTNGTINDPAVEGGASSGWTAAGAVFIRERSTSSDYRRTGLFLKFDLSAIPGTITGARLRIHQVDRLNDIHSANLELSRPTTDWGTTAGTYPLLDTTPVADAFDFGRNDDFGTAVDASGFYSGSIGVVGDDTGFDPDGKMTALAQAWQDGIFDNYGVKIAFSDLALTGAAFSELDDVSTPLVNEQLQLIVTYITVEDKDTDDDLLNDAYEVATFGDMNSTGTDDFDLDGFSNLIERALGSDPTLSNSVPQMDLSVMDPKHVDFHFHRLVDAGLGYEVCVSENLVDWSPFTTYYQWSNSSSESDLGADYDKQSLEAVATLPEQLFFKIDIHGLD